MKKIISIFAIAIMICLPFSFKCVHSSPSDVVVSLQINNKMMKINGQTSEVDAGRATTPVIVNDRTLVPIRAIIEAFGGDVLWDDDTDTTTLKMKNDTIKLAIGSKTAYLNNRAKTLDVAPTIINERTMLPIRFIAEGFNLGVGYNGATQTVYIVRNTFEDDEYQRLVNMLDGYDGRASVKINNNKPFFKEYEIIDAAFEYYSTLDELGRCDVAMASINKELMPTEKRESISSVKPTGWINKAYDNVDGRYLYNRCHLIGFQLTGENANKRNLITGTRYMNVDGMLVYENMVDDYIDNTGNNVMYRITPVFIGDNLVADGVLMEAYSVEDNGAGISFCVYCYNVQPGIIIDYKTGASKSAA